MRDLSTWRAMTVLLTHKQGSGEASAQATQQVLYHNKEGGCTDLLGLRESNVSLSLHTCTENSGGVTELWPLLPHMGLPQLV